jgi:hypothetical protein
MVTMHGHAWWWLIAWVALGSCLAWCVVGAFTEPYLYSCDTAGCPATTELRAVLLSTADEKARDAGWFVTHGTGETHCPRHWWGPGKVKT